MCHKITTYVSYVVIIYMSYNIFDCILKKAKQFDLEIEPSTNKTKKLIFIKMVVEQPLLEQLDVKNYPTYLLEDKEYAEFRRFQYHKRPRKDISVKDSNG